MLKANGMKAPVCLLAIALVVNGQSLTPSIPDDLIPISGLITALEAKNLPLVAALEKIRDSHESPTYRINETALLLDKIHANYRKFKADVSDQVGDKSAPELITGYEQWLKKTVNAVTNSNVYL